MFTRRALLVSGTKAALLSASTIAGFTDTRRPSAQGSWRRLVTTGTRPTERSAAVAGGIGRQLYVFGGVKDDFSTGQNAFYNDLHRLDTHTLGWTRVLPATGTPSARAFAAGAAGPAELFVFGGATYTDTSFEVFDDLWSYSAATNAWSRLTSSTPGPSGRSGATMWTVDRSLFVFGGIDATFTTLNDLWVYHLPTSTWTRQQPSGPVPPARHMGQSGRVERLGRLTVYGGEGDAAQGFPLLGDTWEFSLAQQRWREVTPASGNIDPARNYGATAIVGTNLYLQGGDQPGGDEGCGAPYPQNPTAQLWRFDLSLRTWHLLNPDGDPLVRLKRHTGATVDGRMYVVSGWDFQCPGGVGPGQIWNQDVYRFTPSANAI